MTTQHAESDWRRTTIERSGWAKVWAVVTALVDLVLPTSCGGCGRRAGPGPLCADCVRPLAVEAGRTVPQPAPVGLPACYAVTRYDGVVRTALLAYKERGQRRLVTALGRALAASVDAALAATESRGPDEVAGADRAAGASRASPRVVLVPIPSTAAAIRERGGEHLRPLADVAARRLRARGRDCVVRPLLAAVGGKDSAGLSAAQRMANRRGAFVGRRRQLRRELRPDGRRETRRRAHPDRSAQILRRASFTKSEQKIRYVLVDDLITTGATLAEAARLLRHAGIAVEASAVIAATVRRRV